MWQCVHLFVLGALTMARPSRGEVFDPNEVAIAHVFNRTVRRCFLMGDDALSGKNFDHRKVWIEEYLRQFAAYFGIDLICYAIMSNHFHLILRSRPDVVATWDNREVARRWLMICPVRRSADSQPLAPNAGIFANGYPISVGGCDCSVSVSHSGQTTRKRSAENSSRIGTVRHA
jgi:REP element-mobilizing transposase RayT